MPGDVRAFMRYVKEARKYDSGVWGAQIEADAKAVKLDVSAETENRFATGIMLKETAHATNSSG